MSKIKKLAVLCFMILLGSFVITNSVNAESKYFSYNDLCYNETLLCAQHHQSMYGSTYKLITEINITGNKSTGNGATVESWHNAKLAAILSNKRGTLGNYGGSDVENLPVQNAIWNYLGTWRSEVGYKHGIKQDFVNNSKGNFNTSIETEAEEYANNYKNGNLTQITDKTDKSKIKVTQYTEGNEQYLRVGPFKYEFPEKLSEINVITDKNSKMEIKCFEKRINDNQYSKYSNINQIKSGNEFYISVKMPTDGTSQIKKITVKGKANVKHVTIKFWESTSMSQQNLLQYNYSNEEIDINQTFDYNIKILGNLKVIKVNKDNIKIKLQGVGFYVQNKDTKKWVKVENDTVSYTDKKEDATEFITDKNGEITIKNLVVGTYVAYETKNPNYGYESIKEGQEKSITVDKTAELQIPNKPKYIKLSGYVWVDKVFSKQASRNDLYKDNDYDSNDILLDGITVRLIDKTTGKVVKEAKTADGGKYLFTDVLVDELGNYYIEFEYDGLTYTNVIPHIDKDNGSKVAENSSVRDEFNKGFSVIEGSTESNKGITKDSAENPKYDLNYNIDKNKHTSTLNNTGLYPIKANTNETGYVIKDHFTPGQEEIKYINLGLYERAQPDLALIKNIYSAKVIVNGYEHTYNYEDRFNKNTGENKNIDEFNPENNEEKTKTNVRVKFNQKYGEKSFTRAIYPSDVKETQDKNFSVKVVYKITLKNESGVLYSKINSLVDYFDARYTIEEKGSIGTGYENGEIKDEINYKLDKSYQDAKYRKLIIDCNTKINPNESNRNIYVEYTLTRDSVKDILFDENWDEKTNIEGLENIVEINSYSTYSDKDFTKSYAGIDSDSNPGSTIPGNKDTYEDDTDYAPGLILEVANSREITGTVFEDNAVDPTEGGTNRERLGNGKFDDGEKTISGVQVGLYKEADFEEIKDEDGKIIDMQLESKAKPVGTTTYGGDNKDSTGKDGAFTIKDFAPGEYRIVYFWGDGKYTIEDYKSTIWTSDNKNEKDGNPNTWYRVNTDKRYSDALDNYDTRLKIDRGDTSINKMDSKTPTMVFGVELADDIDNKKTETSGIGKVTFSIENIDFGVIERPRQSIDVTKRAKSMKMTLANGQVIADAKIVEKDGKLQLEQQVKGVIYTEPSDKNNPKNGQIKAEIDNELIQGSKVEIEYEIKVQNNSEIDYDSEKYYCYGEKDVEIVKIKASGVYDYLDNTMIANDENTEWETIKDYNEKVSKPTVIEEYLHKYQSSSTDASGNTEIRIGYEKFEEQYSEAIGNWRIENIITARKKRLADKTILHNANLEGEIAPGEFNMASLTASKILTNTDEIELNNDVEITEVTRTAKTGRKVTPKYTSLYDRGETVTITTPTGENKNYILITIVAISFFVILGTGIVFIKKKILK